MSAKPQLARVAVITGASSGIGLSAAKALASQGWRIIGTGRDAQRIKAAESAIRAVAAAGVAVDVIAVDLASMRDAARAADTIASMTDRIDALLNNAGGTATERIVTAEGNEATFAGNHLGHFVLSNHLLPLLRAAVEKGAWVPRIVNVASAAHLSAPGLDWNDLQMLDNFVPMPAYCNAKLANILFTRELAQRLAGDGIVVHAMHPGIVDSNFAARGDAGLQSYFQTRKSDLISPDDAADTLVWLATASEPATTSGGYFHQRQAVASSAAAGDMQAAHRLWRESEKLTGAFLH
jgi:NAD(P)-dependent dehydrogenase (short-subunit alcohol dehydrogenase family)